jgi:translation initiation factor 3 subunit F
MATQQPVLNLRTGSTKVRHKIHPGVVFSILDHYKRRQEAQTRVIGTLLGEFDDSKTECTIKNCYPVPHLEGEDQLVVDDGYHQAMLALHKRVNPNEVVVGWYSTGDSITYLMSLVHSVYKSQCEEPVLLTVDVNVRKFHRMALKAYVGKSIKVGNKMPLARFELVNLDMFAYEAEKIAVDALINGAPDNDKLDAPATVLSDFENLENSLERLHGLIKNVAAYVKKVQSGAIKGDRDIGMTIAQAVAVIPHFSGTAFEKMFAQNSQDLLMVLYLTNVTRTHLILADKINYLLSDKPA